MSFFILPSNPFERSGFAAFSDLQNVYWKRVYEILENDKNIFNRDLRNKNLVEFPDYPLDFWSRQWEYPFVYYHLNKFMSDNTKKNLICVDIGSGKTLFPFSIMRIGYKVECIEIDPKVVRIIKNVTNYIPNCNVNINITNGKELPFGIGFSYFLIKQFLKKFIPRSLNLSPYPYIPFRGMVEGFCLIRKKET